MNITPHLSVADSLILLHLHHHLLLSSSQIMQISDFQSKHLLYFSAQTACPGGA